MLVVVATAILTMLVMMLVVVAVALLTVVVVMLVVVAMAILTVLVVVLVVVAMAILTVVVVMLVLMLVAVAVLTMLVVMLVLVAVAVLAMLVMMLVLVAVAILTVVVVMLVVMAMLLLESLYRVCQGVALLNSGKNILAVKGVPGGSNYGGIGVLFAQKRNTLGNLVVLRALGMRENYGGGCGYLVVIELAEVLHIHFAFIDVGNCGVGIQHRVLSTCVLYCADNVGELAYARGLDNNSFGLVLLQHLQKCL